MAVTTIKITFNQDLALNEIVNFRRKYDDGTLNTDWMITSEVWKNVRTNNGEVTIGTPTSTPGERSAINFMQSILVDYFPDNGISGFEVSRIANEVTVEANQFWQFDLNSLPNTNPASVGIVIANNVSPFFTISSVVFQEATVPCTHIKVSVTTSQLATTLNLPTGTVTGNTNNPFTFEVLRSQNFIFSIENAEGESLSHTVDNVPSVLNNALLDIDILSSPQGATVTANVPNNVSNEFEFSLDNTIWQSSNVFSGMLQGDYTLYVRDQYGCSFSEDFHVDSFGVNNPFFYISKSNSIRFANRITWGDCGNYKTDENTLSFESDVRKPFQEIQQFQSCDVLTTQFKSNYSDITVTVIKEDGIEINAPITQQSQYLRQKDSRDARKYNRGDGKTGIYFISGNLYDYDTSADTGEDYILNGALPKWGKIGNDIKIGGTWFTIENIVYDEDKYAEVLVINNIYTGVEINTIVSSLYNKKNYEEYEFTIDMVDYVDQNIQVRINNNDPNFTDLVHLSELINVKVRHLGTIELIYTNSKNTDINYSRGLTHKLRLRCEKTEAKSKEDSETETTDTTAYLSSSEVREVNQFTLSPLTKEQMRKVQQALAHDTITIDGVGYVKNTSLDISDALEDTNLYDVIAIMIKTDNVFKGNSSADEFNTTDIEIPALIDSGQGFVIY